ncbi:MAG: hypothetical protein ACK5D5_14030, partial [Bacteroidota bacterium]
MSAEQPKNNTENLTTLSLEKKGKKKSLLKRSLLILLIFLIISPVILIFLIQSHQFQTWAAKKTSSWLSEELKTTIEVEKVAINFFNQVDLKG